MDEPGTYQSVCPRCGRFVSHSIYDDNPRHDYWTCNYCPASGDGNPWDEIPKDRRQEAWDEAQAHVDHIRRGKPMAPKQQDEKSAEGKRIKAFLQEYESLCLKYGIQIGGMYEPCFLSEVDENTLREDIVEYEQNGIVIGK